MENVKDKEIDLGLALGVTNQPLESPSNTGATAGGGANANSRSTLDKNTNTFVGPRPLTELVYSTQNGLTLKCAGCTRCFADPTHEKRLHSLHLGSLTFPKSIPPALLLGSNPPNTDENVGEFKCVNFIERENCNKGKEKESMVTSKNKPIANVAGTSEGIQNRTTADLLPLLANEPEILKTKAKDILNEEGSTSAPFLEKMEETAENDVKDRRVGEDSSKGKNREEESCEKNNERDEDDSHESMESCNSANLVSKGNNKRLRFEQQLIIGSKRIKKQSQECLTTSPAVKQDSSFMNWISNMVKGTKPYQEEAPHYHPTEEQEDDNKTLNLVSKKVGFQTVFQSLYSAQEAKTGTQIESSNAVIKSSKEIIVFDKTLSEHENMNQKAFGNLWITRLSPKTPSTLLASSNKDSSVALTSSETLKNPCEIDVVKQSRDEAPQSKSWCLEMKESGNVFLKKKVSNLNEIPSSSGKNKLCNEEKIVRIPKETFAMIRRLRLSRTDILKWMNSQSPIAKLEGYFVRLRLAKWEEGVGGAGYYVACITDEKPSKGSNKCIRVSIGGVECLVESRYISNCDFLEEELIGWWRATLTNAGAPLKEELTSKLEERKKLGF